MTPLVTQYTRVTSPLTPPPKTSEVKYKANINIYMAEYAQHKPVKYIYVKVIEKYVYNHHKL